MEQSDLLYRYRPLKINAPKQYNKIVMLSHIDFLPQKDQLDNNTLYLTQHQHGEIEAHWFANGKKNSTYLAESKLKNIGLQSFQKCKEQIEVSLEKKPELMQEISSICCCTRPKDIFDELDNQELFLATIEENNDPMDGVQEIFWKGDEVLWNRFLEHYLICVSRCIAIVSTVGNAISLNEIDITMQLRHNINDEISNEIQKHFIRACFIDDEIKEMLEILMAKDIHKEELLGILRHFHPKILSILNRTLERSGVSYNLVSLIKDPPSCSKAVKELMRDKNLTTRNFFKILNDINDEINLIDTYNHYLQNKNDGFWHENIRILTILFPSYYLEKLTQNIFPEYYLSSFSKNNDNSAMWGKYADGHRGICLVFFAEKVDKFLTIETEEKEKLAFYEVKYSETPPLINFFENIGHLPREILDKFWLSYNNQYSSYSTNYGNNFPKDYWNRYGEKFSYKFTDWKPEAEYRIIKNSFFSGRLSKEMRLYHYKFNFLKGIIFGAKTPENIKHKIIEIIEKKIRKFQYKDFKFYQANFCHIKKKLIIKEMKMLKFK